MFPEITVDIVKVIRNPCKSASNTVVIDVKHERSECDDGPPPFANDRVILRNVVSFDPHKTSDVLYSTFQDDVVRGRLCVEMALASEGVPAPFHMYLHVTHRFIDVSDPIPPTEESETCAICMEDMSDDVRSSQMPNCPHEFHNECILKWLAESYSCPLCRTVPEYDSDNYPYYSDSETEYEYYLLEDDELYLVFSD